MLGRCWDAARALLQKLVQCCSGAAWALLGRCLGAAGVLPGCCLGAAWVLIWRWLGAAGAPLGC
eukprot:7509437-Lingulodinium_polyedra.AAC.1